MQYPHFSTGWTVKMLREQAEQLQRDIAALYLQFPELQGDDEVLRVDTIEGATTLSELATAILYGIGDARALYDGTKIRIDELKARQDRFKMRGEFLRGLLLKIMQQAGAKRLELSVATISVKAGAQQLRGDDASALPDDLCRITREPDKIKIRERLQAGEAVPGFALSNGEPSLAVHVK
jgi:hypothetical protein